MKVHVDTNVLIVLLSGDEDEVGAAGVALESASETGALAISPVVYAELEAGGRESAGIEEFLDGTGIEVIWRTDKSVWREAGSRYGRYARHRRRGQEDAGPRRILADFLVGAYALQGSRRLLTSDAKIFATYFPELDVLAP